MDATQSGADTLNIHRLRTQYLVSSDHPNPESVRTKLDWIASKKLAGDLGLAVLRYLPTSAQDIWLIRSLTLDIDLNLDCGEEQLAWSWAEQVARSVGEILESGADKHEVLHFPDHAAYLARFMLDLVDGSAWNKWYYRRFDGLRMLPSSAALRTTICAEAESGERALLQMNADGRRRLIESLTDSDARQILDAIAARDSVSAGTPVFEQISPSFAEECAFCALDNRAALHLYLRACSGNSAASGRQLKALVLAVVCLFRNLRDQTSSRSDSLVHALADGDVASLYRLAGVADGEVLMPLLGAPSSWLQAVGRPMPMPPRTHESLGETLRHTALGGIFLLLPLLDEMPIADATSGWPEMPNCPPAQLVRFLLLMKCCGAVGASQLFQDPLARDLLGISPELDAASVVQWQTSLSLKKLFTFQVTLAKWHMENWIEQERNLSVLAARREQRPSLLCFDSSRQMLLLALPHSRSSQELLADSLSKWLPDPTQVTASDRDLAAPDESSNESLGGPSAKELSPTGRYGSQTALPGNQLHQMLDDLSFLALPLGLRGPQRSELAFSAVAHGLLRNLSRRLPGFSHCSLTYLHRNFLELHASLKEEPAQRIVRLGRPPLHVVLSISGMDRQRYQLKWTDARPFALFPEE